MAKPSLRAETPSCQIINGISCSANLLAATLGQDFWTYGVWRKRDEKFIQSFKQTNGEISIPVEIEAGENIFEVYKMATGSSGPKKVTPEPSIPGVTVTGVLTIEPTVPSTTTTTNAKTTTTTTSSTIPPTTGLKFFADKTVCAIPFGESRCSVKLYVDNPYNIPLVIDRVHPLEGRKTITGILGRSAEILFEWVTVGTFVFILNDPAAKKDYASLTVIGQSGASATSTTSTIPSNPKLTADKSTCVIPSGASRCSVKLTVSNPRKLPLVIDRVHPQEGRKTFTGAITDTVAEITFEWVTAGVFVFILNDPTTRVDYSSVTVTGLSNTPTTLPTTTTTLSANPKLTADKSICVIPSGASRCSVQLTVFNPRKQPLVIDRVHPQEGRKTFTGILTDTTAEITFEWVTAGIFVFILNDPATRTDYSSVTVTGQKNTPTTTTTSSTTTTTLLAVPRLTAERSSCAIPPGEIRCSIKLSVSNNLNRLPLKVDRIHPSPQEPRAAITGEFDDAAYQLSFDWVTTGAFTFVLYNARTNQEYARTTVSGLPSTQSLATRSVFGATFSLLLQTNIGVISFAAEEQLPSGVTPSGISNNGKWDVANRKIKWGPFRNTTNSQSLRYSACGSGEIVGSACFDGSCISISGVHTLSPCLRRTAR